MKQAALIVKEDGLIYVNEVPEEPKIRETNRFMYPDERKRVNAENYAYEKALSAAKDSAILCADQEQATERLIKSGVCVSMEINKPLIALGIYPIEGLKWEVVPKAIFTGPDPEDDFNVRPVALLTPSEPSKQKQKELLIKMLNDKSDELDRDAKARRVTNTQELFVNAGASAPSKGEQESQEELWQVVAWIVDTVSEGNRMKMLKEKFTITRKQ